MRKGLVIVNIDFSDLTGQLELFAKNEKLDKGEVRLDFKYTIYKIQYTYCVVVVVIVAAAASAAALDIIEYNVRYINV